MPQVLATTLGLREEASRPLLATLVDHLRPKRVLLLFDNCEHLLDACAHLAEALLRGCLAVKILPTSREALGLAGEVSFRVPPLSLPDSRHVPPLEHLADYEAIQLFVDRAVAVKPDFALTVARRLPVVQICQQLDGIPLAIELAAARVRTLSVQQITVHLDERFRLLTGGSRTALPRHQTLRGSRRLELRSTFRGRAPVVPARIGLRRWLDTRSGGGGVRRRGCRPVRHCRSARAIGGQIALRDGRPGQRPSLSLA